jgi:hypothetical protein
MGFDSSSMVSSQPDRAGEIPAASPARHGARPIARVTLEEFTSDNDVPI